MIWKSEDDAEKEIKKTEDKEDDVIEKERNIRLAKEAQKQSEKDELVCKIEKEIETEKEKAKLLYMIENSRKKLEKKNADMIAANNLKVEGAGFGTDTNIVTLITKEDMIELPKLSKEDTAGEILSEIMKHFF